MSIHAQGAEQGARVAERRAAAARVLDVQIEPAGRDVFSQLAAGRLELLVPKVGRLPEELRAADLLHERFHSIVRTARPLVVTSVALGWRTLLGLTRWLGRCNGKPFMRRGASFVPGCASAALGVWFVCVAGCASPLEATTKNRLPGDHAASAEGARAGRSSSAAGAGGSITSGRPDARNDRSQVAEPTTEADAGNDRSQVAEPATRPEDCELAPLETWRAMNNVGAPNPQQPVAAWVGQRMRVLDLQDFSVAVFDPCANRWEPGLPPAPELAQQRPELRNTRFTGTRYAFKLRSGWLYFDPVSGKAEMKPDVAEPPAQPADAIDNPNRIWNVIADPRYEVYWSGAVRDNTLAVLELRDGGHYFDAETAVWSEFAETGAPAARYTAAFARHGDTFALFGGFAHLGVPYVETAKPIQDGALYDMKTNTWTPIPSEGAPSQCDGNNQAPYSGCMLAFWNGHQLLAYSPVTINNNVFSGGIYDVEEGSWRTLAPPPFTLGMQANNERKTDGGQLLYVMGNNDIAYAQLALLDLERNAWREIKASLPASQRLPEGGTRIGFVEVWTGKTLIRWLPELSVNTSCRGNIPPGAGCDPSPSMVSRDPGIGYMLTIDECGLVRHSCREGLNQEMRSPD